MGEYTSKRYGGGSGCQISAQIKKQTVNDLCELLPVVFEATQKWNPIPQPPGSQKGAG